MEDAPAGENGFHGRTSMPPQDPEVDNAATQDHAEPSLKRRASLESSELAAQESRNGASPDGRTRQPQGNVPTHQIRTKPACEDCLRLNRKCSISHPLPPGVVNSSIDHSMATPTLTDSTMDDATPESSHTSTPYPDSPRRLHRMQERSKPGGPFKCTFKGCNRDRAFTNKNDLERHMKSVHGIRPASSMGLQSYSCKGRDCTGKSKIWPRLDNFRAHCLRMHPKEDLESLIQRSSITVPGRTLDGMEIDTDDSMPPFQSPASATGATTRPIHGLPTPANSSNIAPPGLHTSVQRVGALTQYLGPIDDIVTQGDFVQFGADSRCEACQSSNQKCLIQEDDERCIFCAGADRDCVFLRITRVRAPKSAFTWSILVKRDEGHYMNLNRLKQ